MFFILGTISGALSVAIGILLQQHIMKKFVFGDEKSHKRIDTINTADQIMDSAGVMGLEDYMRNYGNPYAAQNGEIDGTWVNPPEPQQQDDTGERKKG